jgi:hypothetical protein
MSARAISGWPSTGHAHARGVVGEGPRERAALVAKQLEAAVRKAAAALAAHAARLQRHQLLRVPHRQGSHQVGVDDAEDRRVRADAERERRDDGQREAGVFREHPHAVARVLPGALEPRPDPHAARVLARQRLVAERAPAGVLRVGARQAVALQLLLAQRAVRLELFCEIRVQPAPTHPVAKPADQRTHRLRPSAGLSDRRDQAVELLALGGELFATERRQRVVARAPVVLGGAPLGVDPAVQQQPLQRRVQRALADLQHVVGDLLQALAMP